MSKVWMITGASRGIGLAIARAALKAGHQVVATARKPQQVTQALPGHGERLLAVQLDLTRPERAGAAVDEAVDRFGNIDVLVNNAGYGQLGWFENVSEKQIREQFETNVFGTMSVTRAVLPVMRSRHAGHIFTYSSVAGQVTFPGASVYAASKFALEGWMEGLAQEVKPLGISATLIEPGYFRSDFLEPNSIAYGEQNIADYAESTAAFTAFHDQINRRQMGDPDKLAQLMLELADMAEPPLRFAAGSDAVQYIGAKIEALRSGLETFAELSRSTDYPAGTDANS
jgi:NAD(P)-dependent dehydrogenase (short-subunit alcohol dehydrogenase family)